MNIRQKFFDYQIYKIEDYQIKKAGSLNSPAITNIKSY